MMAKAPAAALFDREQVDDEDQGRFFRAVREIWRDDHLTATTHLHPFDPLFPSGAHYPAAEVEGERFAPVPGGFELLAGLVIDRDVLDRHFVAELGFRSLAH